MPSGAGTRGGTGPTGAGTTGAIGTAMAGNNGMIASAGTPAAVSGTAGAAAGRSARLRSADGRITEIESLIIRDDSYLTPPDPAAVLGTMNDVWEVSLAADQRSTREQLAKVVDTYFGQFPNGACNFASDCTRLENGFNVGACDFLLGCDTSGVGALSMKTRLHVIDVEAGITAGFTMFNGITGDKYSDFHMFKVRGGQVHGVQAVLSAAASSGWD